MKSSYGEIAYGPCRDILGIDIDNLQSSFDRWWHIERAEGYIEIEPSWLGPYYGFPDS